MRGHVPLHARELSTPGHRPRTTLSRSEYYTTPARLEKRSAESLGGTYSCRGASLFEDQMEPTMASSFSVHPAASFSPIPMLSRGSLLTQRT